MKAEELRIKIEGIEDLVSFFFDSHEKFVVSYDRDKVKVSSPPLGGEIVFRLKEGMKEDVG